MAQLSHLPNELLLKVFENFPARYSKRTDLYNLCLVDRRFNLLATPFLYHTIVVEFNKNDTFHPKIVRSLLRFDHSSLKYIREVSVREVVERLGFFDSSLSEIWNDTRKTFIMGFLQKLRNNQLHALRLDRVVPNVLDHANMPKQGGIREVDCQPPYDPEEDKVYPWPEFLSFPDQSLKSLCFRNLEAGSSASLVRMLERQCESLRELTLYCSKFLIYEEGVSWGFWPGMDIKRACDALFESWPEVYQTREDVKTRKGLENLENLTLIEFPSNAYLDVVFPGAKDLIKVRKLKIESITGDGMIEILHSRFPNLCEVTITNDVGDMGVLEDFLRNCSPLKSLVVAQGGVGRHPDADCIARHTGLRKLWLELSPGYISSFDQYLLTINSAQSGAFCVPQLPSLRNLEELALAFNTTDLDFIYQLPQLRTIRFLNFPSTSDADILSNRLSFGRTGTSTISERKLVDGRFIVDTLLQSLPQDSSIHHHLSVIILGRHDETILSREAEIYLVERNSSSAYNGNVSYTAYHSNIYDARYHHPNLEFIEQDRLDSARFGQF